MSNKKRHAGRGPGAVVGSPIVRLTYTVEAARALPLGLGKIFLKNKS